MRYRNLALRAAHRMHIRGGVGSGVRAACVRRTCNQSCLRSRGKSAAEQPRRGAPAHRRAEQDPIAEWISCTRASPARRRAICPDRASASPFRVGLPPNSVDMGNPIAAGALPWNGKNRDLGGGGYQGSRRGRHRIHQSWLCRHLHGYWSQRRQRKFRPQSRTARLTMD